MNITIDNSDERWMREALAEAQQAYDNDEIPIGAIVVTEDGRVLGRGHNMTEALSDVTAHAEMLALTAAASSSGGKYLSHATMYVTVEPCTMCAGALGWSQIGRVVYGASDDKRGYRTVCDNCSPFHKTTRIHSGVLADECAQLMKSFFSKKCR